MAVVYYNSEHFEENPLGEPNVKLLYVCQADVEDAIIPTAMHAHEEHLELQYISGGRAHIRIDGKAYDVQEGDVIVYNAGVIHDERADPDCGMSFYNCGLKNFQSACLPKNHLLPQGIKPVLHSDAMADTVRAIFHELYEQISQKKFRAAAVCHHLICALLIILENQLPHENLASWKFDAPFQRCKDFIDKNFTENISVEDMSKIAHMSVSGFSHYFKKVFGLSPVQYLIRLKIGASQKLLIGTDKNITEISMELGYDNVTHFNNQFKKYVGTSPQNYRRLWVGNEQFKHLNHLCSVMN